MSLNSEGPGFISLKQCLQISDAGDVTTLTISQIGQSAAVVKIALHLTSATAILWYCYHIAATGRFLLMM
jgi:hypothetical protein